MENRHRLLLGINVESFRRPASETDGGRCGAKRSVGTGSAGFAVGLLQVRDEAYLMG